MDGWMDGWKFTKLIKTSGNLTNKKRVCVCVCYRVIRD